MGAFPGGSVVKNPTAKQEMQVQSLGGRSHGEGNGNPLQYFCLGNPTDRGATVHGVARVAHNLVTNQQKQQSDRERQVSCDIT